MLPKVIQQSLRVKQRHSYFERALLVAQFAKYLWRFLLMSKASLQFTSGCLQRGPQAPITLKLCTTWPGAHGPYSTCEEHGEILIKRM